jgi:hypothetical protein
LPGSLGGKTLQEMQRQVREDTRLKEMKTIREGHPERVAPEDREACMKEVAEQEAAEAAKKAAQAQAEEARLKEMAANKARDAAADKAWAEKERQDHERQMKLNHCPQSVHIGTSETCVYLIEGQPTRVNEDLRSGTQLVYRKYVSDTDTQEKYIYIDLNGRVANVQTSY